MSAHTPGPWFPGMELPVSHKHAPMFVTGNSGRCAGEVGQANARLIAEAPAMLEALRAEQSIEDDMIRDGSMLSTEHEERSKRAAEMRCAVLARIDGAA